MNEEEWRVIPKFQDYMVSSIGRVKRIRPDKNNHKVSELKISVTPRGYGCVCLCDNGIHVTVRINRLVCTVFNGEPPTEKHHAAHNDGDVSNNSKDNLRWATGKENEADKRIHGTAAIGDKHWSKKNPEKRAKGSRHGLSKLTEKDIPKIRSDKRFQRDIAADYGVTQRVIWSIKKRITWRHVP
jgi:hypothetical protein